MINNLKKDANSELKYYLALQEINGIDDIKLIEKRFEEIIEQLEGQCFYKIQKIKTKEEYRELENTFFKLKEQINILKQVQRDLFDLETINRQIEINKKILKNTKHDK